MIHLFTYGTLEIPEVMEAVTGRTLASAEGRARGFAKFLLRGRIYPGMTAVQGAICSGRVYYDMDSRTLEILDAFEDEVYTRQRVDVEVTEGRSLQAYAYLILPQDRACLTSAAWQPDEFITKHLVLYLEACKAFHRDVSVRSPYHSR
ncbi:MAG: gamma-glutamylcyclotransferase [Nitrospira sp.]|nr:gamma-glutamylcyclotransferase [Nitrospira sp.]